MDPLPFLIFLPSLLPCFFLGSVFLARTLLMPFAYTTPVPSSSPCLFAALPRSRVISALVVIICVPTLSAPALLLSVFLSSACLPVCLLYAFIHIYKPIMLSRHLPSYSVCKSIIVYSYITMRSRNVNVEKRGFFKNKSASCREETERRKIGDSGG
jgi:hypothetical protein